MNTFVNSINSHHTLTDNGMPALSGTSSPVVDLFYKIGAMRGQDVIPAFVAAYVADKDLAIRIALWARDIRGGAGERQLFRNILSYLDKNDPDVAIQVLAKVPELGRWDDLLLNWTNAAVQTTAFNLIKDALVAGNGLCAKWMPREPRDKAVVLCQFFGWSRRYYRKRLVELTKVVESQMCSQDWDNINYSHVPSVAAARYKKAFARHTIKYTEYGKALASGDKSVKVNAGAVYPYDVLKQILHSPNIFVGPGLIEADINVINAQWNALPNYMGSENVLPMIDVSGSMSFPIGGRNSSLMAVHVAISLGLYAADKAKGAFKDVYMTFNGSPSLEKTEGTIIQKVQQMSNSWDGRSQNTNLEAAFNKIIAYAQENKVSPADMPTMLVIISDMQFDECINDPDASAFSYLQDKYKLAGYAIPKVVFWNILNGGNVPVKSNEHGVALISGFSPSIFTAILGSNLDEFTPEAIMRKTVTADRYKWQVDESFGDTEKIYKIS